MSKRLEKVSKAIKQELGDIILKETKNPKLKMVSISRVEVSPDLKHANVFFTTVKGSALEAEKALKNAEGMLKTRLAKRIRLRFTPQLNFYVDKGVDHALKISRILKKIKEEQ